MGIARLVVFGVGLLVGSMLLGSPAGAPLASAATGSIAGTVTDGVNPIPGATVTLTSFSCCSFQQTTTAGDGTYSVPNLDDGSYRINAKKPGYAPEYYNDTYLYNGATAVNVAGGGPVGNINFSLVQGGSFSGVVTNESASPIVGATVTASNGACDCSESIITSPGGTYTLNSLPPGDFRVEVSASGYAAEYYNNSYDFDDVALVTVSLGNNTPNIHFALAAEANITGTVTNGSGAPVANANVRAYQYINGSFGGSAFTNGAGVYSIAGLPPVCFRVSTSADGFAPEYYNNTYVQGSAAQVCPSSGGTQSDINFGLAAASHITGTVTDGGGSPLAGVQVYADNGECCDGLGKESAATAGDGTYNIGSLPPGDYTVRFSKDGYVEEYFDNALDFDAADAVHVALSATAGNVNASLATTGSISGRVTNNVGANVVGAEVQAQPYECCGGTSGNATTAGDGTYTITGLPAGNYTVAVTNAGTYATSRYYPGTYDEEAAAAVTVAADTDTPDINIALEPGGTISGSVSIQGGGGIGAAQVNASCDQCSGSRFAYSAGNGTYALPGLPPGEYRVSAQAQGYVEEYYNGVYNSGEATPINITPGGSVSSINFALSGGGSISGFVQDAYGAPIAGAEINVSGAPCCSQFVSGADGSFTVTTLPPGDHTLQVNADGYVSEYYEDGYDFLQASQIAVVDGANTPNIYVILGGGSILWGTVRDGASAPIANATVFGELAGGGGGISTTTRDDGGYTLTGAAPGSYRLRASAAGYAPEYFINTFDQSAATLVPTGGGGTSGLNFTLGAGGGISGTVTNSSAVPIESAFVRADRTVCCYSGFADTAPNGSYTMVDMPPGQYRVQVVADGYAGEYYNNAYPEASATLVTVTGTATTQPISFSLADAANITGTVSDGVNPLPGALVTATRDGGGGFFSAVTNGAGMYTFPKAGMPAGSYRVTAEKPGFGREFYQDKYNFAAGDLVTANAGATTGGINLALAAVNPNNSSQPIPVPALPYSNTRSTAGATLETGEPAPCGATGATIWYAYVVPPNLPNNLALVADTAGSSFNTVLAVHNTAHSFSPPGGFTQVGCNDTNGASPQARLAFTAVKGETYYFQAGGASGATGSLTLALSCTNDADCDSLITAVDNCPSVFNPTQTNIDADGQGDACDTDDDGDGCTDTQERGPAHELGGDRNPNDFWDFYDITNDRQIDLSDALDLLGLFGIEPSAPGYIPEYDRHAPNPAKQWRTAYGNDGFGIDLSDVLINLASFGDGCA